MSIFQRRKTPEAFGALLYEALRTGLTLPGPLSIDGLCAKLADEGEVLDDQHAGEIVIGAMYAAATAIDRSTQRGVADRIIDGMTGEFLRHLGEQGASALEIGEWRSIMHAHFADYRDVLLGYEGFEPPWKFGRQLLWCLTGSEDHAAVAVRDATVFLLAVRDAAQELVNAHGPALLIEAGSGTVVRHTGP
jgi:hypothetical protein